MTASCTVTIKLTVPNCSGPANQVNPDLSSVQVKYGFLYDFCTTSALTSFATQLSTLYNIWKHFLVIHTTPRVLCRQIFYFDFLSIKIRFLKIVSTIIVFSTFHWFSHTELMLCATCCGFPNKYICKIQARFSETDYNVFKHPKTGKWKSYDFVRLSMRACTTF